MSQKPADRKTWRFSIWSKSNRRCCPSTLARSQDCVVLAVFHLCESMKQLKGPWYDIRTYARQILPSRIALDLSLDAYGLYYFRSLRLFLGMALQSTGSAQLASNVGHAPRNPMPSSTNLNLTLICIRRFIYVA